MILYKYVSLASARSIISSNQIGFSRSRFFNDPFDTPLAVPVPADNLATELIANIGAWGKSTVWEENSGILSLTRTATNPLMWAHYADHHRGAVLAIDMKKAQFLETASNLIPAHFGSVVYSRHRVTGPYHSKFSEPIIVGGTHHFPMDHFEKLQRLFLNKPLEWAYEEEVRVVKCLKGLENGDASTTSGTFTVVNIHDRPLHCFHLPQNAITGIYFGARTEKNQKDVVGKLSPDISIHQAKLHEHAFIITFEKLD